LCIRSTFYHYLATHTITKPYIDRSLVLDVPLATKLVKGRRTTSDAWGCLSSPLHESEEAAASTNEEEEKIEKEKKGVY
jgi:hypothetical protein